jgi:peptidyl-tRNA hydrolase
MNRTLSYGAKLFAHLDPSKGVGSFRQQDGGHGSRNPLRSVIQLRTRKFDREKIKLVFFSRKKNNIFELQEVPIEKTVFPY